VQKVFGIPFLPKHKIRQRNVIVCVFNFNMKFSKETNLSAVVKPKETQKRNTKKNKKETQKKHKEFTV